MKKFIEAYEENVSKESEQIRLRKKHSINDQNVVVVEKNNFFKFTVRSIANLVHVGATIILVGLAVIGLICIMYESTRLPLIKILNDIFIQIRLEG